MKNFWRGISVVMFYVIGSALLIYTSSRSLDFISSTLPGNQQIVGFLGLAATSGGMVNWLMLFMHHGKGLGQKVTAGLMVGVDLLGEIGLFTADTLYRSAQAGMIAALTQDEVRAVIIALSALIAINIISTVAYHLLDINNLRAMREEFVRDQLEAKALEAIEKRGEQLAEQLGPKLAEQWIKEFEQRFSDFRALGFGSSMKSNVDENQPNAKQDQSINKPASIIPRPILPLQNSAPVIAPPEAVIKGNGHNGNTPDPS